MNHNNLSMCSTRKLLNSIPYFPLSVKGQRKFQIKSVDSHQHVAVFLKYDAALTDALQPTRAHVQLWKVKNNKINKIIIVSHVANEMNHSRVSLKHKCEVILEFEQIVVMEIKAEKKIHLDAFM